MCSSRRCLRPRGCSPEGHDGNRVGNAIMSDDVEALKKHKIVSHDDGKRHLGQLGGVPLGALLSPEEQRIGEAGEAFAGGDEVLEAKPVEAIREDILDALRGIYDPEIPVNIVDLGLIYDINVDAQQNVEVSMTLTAPACPVAGMLVRRVAQAAGGLASVRGAHVKLTWDPPWTQERMSEEALLELGLL